MLTCSVDPGAKGGQIKPCRVQLIAMNANYGRGWCGLLELIMLVSIHICNGDSNLGDMHVPTTKYSQACVVTSIVACSVRRIVWSSTMSLLQPLECRFQIHLSRLYPLLSDAPCQDADDAAE